MDDITQAIFEQSEGVPWFVVVMCIFAPAIIGWGITEGLKLTLLNRWRYKYPEESLTLTTKSAIHRGFEKSKYGWWVPLLVFLNIAIGAVVGSAIGAIGWVAVYGSAAGAGGGVLSSAIVAYVKKRLKLKGSAK